MRLIDANVLREEILTENYDNDTINNFLDLVDLSPTIDAEPVVHGNWNVERNNGSIMFTCSSCGYGYADIDSVFIDEPHKYCPECGAIMDEDKCEI